MNLHAQHITHNWNFFSSTFALQEVFMDFLEGVRKLKKISEGVPKAFQLCGGYDEGNMTIVVKVCNYLPQSVAS